MVRTDSLLPGFVPGFLCGNAQPHLELRAKVAEAEAGIHLVEPPESESELKAAPSDEATT